MTLTTIDIENLRELRAYLLETNRTLKLFVNEAVKEKRAREQGQSKLPLDFEDDS
jgi:hypothetical protein